MKHLLTHSHQTHIAYINGHWAIQSRLFCTISLISFFLLLLLFLYSFYVFAFRDSSHFIHTYIGLVWLCCYFCSLCDRWNGVWRVPFKKKKSGLVVSIWSPLNQFCLLLSGTNVFIGSLLQLYIYVPLPVVVFTVDSFCNFITSFSKYVSFSLVSLAVIILYNIKLYCKFQIEKYQGAQKCIICAFDTKQWIQSTGFYEFSIICVCLACVLFERSHSMFFFWIWIESAPAPVVLCILFQNIIR